ncbi:MAG: hypothetical protein DBP01_02515 [gamma proteobacterium symbiont of Ctena orbiculata]|nr:MAG: hypothetical protein DBP01_02515 [gamma proteobacterium symbiont of Ctena orbiculata]
MADGTNLSCTDDHPLWVENKGWCVVNPRKAAENYGLTTRRLLSGDRLLVLVGGSLKPVKLENIAFIERPSRMWIVGTDSNHPFFANGVLAHDENIGSLDLSDVSGVVVAKSNMQSSEKLALS